MIAKALAYSPLQVTDMVKKHSLAVGRVVAREGKKVDSLMHLWPNFVVTFNKFTISST